MAKEVTKREAQTMVAVLSSALAIGTAHVVALAHARNQMEGGVRTAYTGLIVLQSLGLAALTVGQGAAIFASKVLEDKPEPVVGTRDFTVRPPL